MIPIRKWVIDPAESTITRCQVGLRKNARGASSAVTSSSAVIPAMSQKPPAGIALSPYSVSPRRKENTFGPNPMK